MPAMPKPPNPIRSVVRYLLVLLLPATSVLAFATASSSVSSSSVTSSVSTTTSSSPIDRPARLARLSKMARAIRPTAPVRHRKPRPVSVRISGERLIHRYFPRAAWPGAVAVATCESHFNPVAIHYDSNGTHDRGVFQLNDGGTAQYLMSMIHQNPSNLNLAFNPVLNVRAAALLYKRDGWSQWSCAA